MVIRMKKKMSCLLLAGAVTAGFMGCGSETLSDSSVNLAASYQKTEGDESDSKDNWVSGGEQLRREKFGDAYADFAVELLRNTAKSGENSMISPLSVLLTLTMAENGAAGETLAQMEQTFCMGTVEEQNKLLLSFAKGLSDTKKSRISLANSIWCKDKDEAFHVSEDFLKKNAEYFQADLFSAPFDNRTLSDINTWVKKETEGMIPDILDEISPDTVMYLINAVAFEAEWDIVYMKEAVHEREFSCANGETCPAVLMYSEEFFYLEDEDTTGFLKPYADGYSFAAMLPKEGIAIADYLEGFSGDKYRALVTNPITDVSVSAAIPKFTAEYKTELSGALCKMGMPMAFDELQADFSGLGSYKNGCLYIDFVLHKTYISVDELGTKAGAVTAAGINKCAAIEPEEPKRVILDRPFVYAVVENETMMPIFIGVVEQIN